MPIGAIRIRDDYINFHPPDFLQLFLLDLHALSSMVCRSAQIPPLVALLVMPPGKHKRFTGHNGRYIARLLDRFLM